MDNLKKYIAYYPRLMEEWDWEKNNNYDPNRITVGSHNKVWWKCKKGHSWEALIYPRLKGTGCPYCNGKKAIKGVSDFATLHSEMLVEWDYEKNDSLGIKPEDIMIGSQKKVNWICSKGHGFTSSIYDRLNGRGKCPFCAKKKLKTGINDLATTNPDLVNEWDYEKNIVKPEEISTKYNKKVWWKCEKGHSWEALIYPRLKNVGCPYCSNNKALKGYNDLTTTNPEIIKYWNYDKNDNINPTMFTHGSTKYLWWKCEEGHSWKAKVSDVVRGSRCPYCLNKKILEGYNDLASKNPEVLKYWDYEKNEKKPTQFSPKSNKKVWWICDKGHSYCMTISVRLRGNYHSCPLCTKYQRTSLPEKIILYYLSKKYKCIEENYQPEWLKPKELDIYIPELMVGIEYDGSRYHQDIKQDYEKDVLCEQNGVKMIRIRELGCPKYESSATKIMLKKGYSPRYTYLEQAFNELKTMFEFDIKIEIEKDLDEVLKLLHIGKKRNCVAITNPEILVDWDYEENEKAGLSPYNVTKGSNVRANWVCEKGHKYKASVAIKTSQHTSCPFCKGRKILKGFNDLATTNPELVDEWDYEKNIKTPEQVSRWDIKKYYWKCKKGHGYKAAISNRTEQNCGCPICSGHQILEGYNDIKTNSPELLKEWDYEKNSDENIRPENEKKGSQKNAWWICEKGHSYKAKISARIRGTGCPYCAGKKVLKGFNDIETTHSWILKDWNFTKNIVKPDEITQGSHLKVWWTCNEGHSYEATISARIRGTGCPFCSGNKVLEGFNDIATTNPELLNKWNYQKNNELGITPKNISKSYSKKVWWICQNGHEYQRYVYSERKGTGKCPICNAKKC